MLFTSNVFNIMNWFVDGLEPRTGMYIRTIPVAMLPSCDMQGPSLDLKLYFNQFNDQDYGFGKGWELNLPRIDTGTDKSRTLILADGSRYKILDDSTSEVKLQYKRTRIFKVECANDADGKTYIIFYKNGMVDYVFNDRIESRVSTNGYHLEFLWGNDNTLKIEDSLGSVLLSSTWDGTAHIVTTKRNVLRFDVGNRSAPTLVSVKDDVPKVGQIPLYFISYGFHNESYLRIKEFYRCADFFRKDMIFYEDLMVPVGFPGKVCFAKYLYTNYATAQYVTVTYSQPGNNYLGFPVVKTWVNNTDNIESDVNFSYEAQILTGSSQKITQIYDRFYLLRHDYPLLPDQTEKSIRNGKSTRYDYKIDMESGIEGQCSTFNTPVGIYKVRYGIQKAEGVDVLVFRETSILYEYDDDGNLVSLLDEDGTRTVYDYYPAVETKNEKGVVLCPADPGGFVNYLKRSTHEPDQSSQLPPRCHEYQYKNVGKQMVQPILHRYFEKGKGAPDPGLFLCKDVYEYEENSTAKNVGALKKCTSSKVTDVEKTVDGKLVVKTQDTVTDHVYSFSAASTSDPTLSIEIRVTGFDGNTRSTTSTYLVATGNCQSAVDENGLKTSYEYDSLGRLIKKSYPWGMDGKQEAVDTIKYDGINSSLTRNSSTQKYTIMETLNPMGKVICERYKLAKPGAEPKYFNMAVHDYNELGQLKKTSLSDYSTDGKKISEVVSHYVWDIFDEPVSKTDASGGSEIFSYDYYNNTMSIRSTPGNCLQCHYYNDNHFLVKVEKSVYGKAGIDQTDTYEYDGFGRLSIHCSNQGEKIEYTYDAFDRVIRKTGSTSGTREIRYAPHSTAELVIEQKVLADKPGNQDTLLGQRIYDGLDRVISETVNQIQASYEYTNSPLKSRPRRIVYKDGRSFEYEYSAALNAILSRKVIARKVKVGDPDVVIGWRNFIFDTVTGNLAQARNGENPKSLQCQQDYIHDDFSHLEKVKTTCWDLLSPTAARTYEIFSTSYNYSLRNKTIETSCLVEFINYVEEDLVVKKRYNYENETGDVSQIDFFINETLRSRSVFTRNGGGGGVINRIDHYNCITGNVFALFSSWQEYGDYCLLKKKKYGCDESAHGTPYHFLIYDLKYNARGQILEVSHSLWNKKWKESCSYDDTGFMKNWSTTGMVEFKTEYSDKVVSLSFKQNKAGNICQTALNHALYETAPKNNDTSYITTYSYDPGSTRLLMLSNRNPHDLARSGGGYPDKVEYEQDVEGHVIKEISTFSQPSKIRVKDYAYTGEDSFTKVRVAEGNSVSGIDYYFDPDGKIVKTNVPQETQGELQISSRLYAEGSLFMEVELKKNYIKSAYTFRATYQVDVFHVVNGEIAFISRLRSKGKAGQSWTWDFVSTFPCLAQVNSDHLAIGSYKKHRQSAPNRGGGFYRGPGRTVVTAVYDFVISAQNAYGFTFNVESKELKIKGGLYTLDSQGKMVRYHGSPPDEPIV